MYCRLLGYEVFVSVPCCSALLLNKLTHYQNEKRSIIINTKLEGKLLTLMSEKSFNTWLNGCIETTDSFLGPDVATILMMYSHLQQV